MPRLTNSCIIAAAIMIRSPPGPDTANLAYKIILLLSFLISFEKNSFIETRKCIFVQKYLDTLKKHDYNDMDVYLSRVINVFEQKKK